MSESNGARPTELVEHFFRHEYAKLVARLARMFGVARLEMIEDAVQGALMLALTSWALRGPPNDPGAWLYRAAHNRVIDALRHQQVQKRAQAHDEQELALESSPEPHFARELEDDQLRMLFVCCDETIPVESQLVLALKVLCGFGIGEVARALFISEANARKRLERARERLRALTPTIDTPSNEVLRDRLQRVQTVIYLLFNEGYLSSQGDRVVRRELCEEALRLCLMLASHPIGGTPETHALLALMYFHSARFEARVDGDGDPLLLEEQDRSRWDQTLLQAGVHWLARSARGAHFSRYHAEAGIAAEHCLAKSFAETRWDEIAALYELLERVAPSPLNVLNRAVAVAQCRGPRAALELLAQAEVSHRLAEHHLRDAVLGDLYRQAGDYEQAIVHLRCALSRVASPAERILIERRIAQCTH